MSISRPDTYTLQHPLLGPMTGVITPQTSDVVSFRAIPYATLSGRFRRSLLKDNLDGLSGNFTKQGFACPHTFVLDDVHSGGPYPGQKPIETSEFESLILEVNVPRRHLEESGKERSGLGNASNLLPVMTYIHGGGFVIGKIDAQHNTAYIAQYSIDIGSPTITTAIQYRLGALGWLCTPDGGSNFALVDQKNALLWIQKFVAGFGGDQSRHTVFGESAGGYSICCHMLSHVPTSGPLFSRAIIMSGVVGPMMTPSSIEKGREAFEEICKLLEIKEKGEAALEALRKLDVQKLVEASDAWIGKGNMYSPMDDLTFFLKSVTWDQIPKLFGECAWVKDLIVGNTAFEGLAYPSIANKLNPSSFEKYLRMELSNEAAADVMKAYSVTPEMDQNLFATSAMRWCGELIFDAPIHALANHVASIDGRNVYRYIFNVRNPFPNAPFYQQAHHWVDIYFLFRTMQFRLPPHLKALSDQHAQLWIDFANGRAPWTSYDEPGSKFGVVMIADERDGWTERTLHDHEKIEREVVSFERLEQLWTAWDEKRGGTWIPLDMKAL